MRLGRNLVSPDDPNNNMALFSFTETLCKFSIAKLSIPKLGYSSVLIMLIDWSLQIKSFAIINLDGISTKLN